MFYRIAALWALIIVLSAPAAADCAADVKSATEAALANAPFRLNWTSESDGATTESSADIVAIDRMTLGPYVMTPQGYFVGGNKVSELDGDGRAIFSDLRPLVNIGKGGIENAECLGKTSFENGEFTAYKFQTESALLGMMGKADVSIYVDDKGLPAWLQMTTRVPGVGEAKQKVKYAFDPTIVINDP
jgi:hypothetical protein